MRYRVQNGCHFANQLVAANCANSLHGNTLRFAHHRGTHVGGFKTTRYCTARGRRRTGISGARRVTERAKLAEFASISARKFAHFMDCCVNFSSYQGTNGAMRRGSNVAENSGHFHD
jgi:hypothetical protein